MSVVEIDKELTLTINSFRAEWADGFFYYVSQPWIWSPLVVVLLCFGWKRLGWKQLLLAVGCAVVCLLLSDQICNLIKISVCRLRPTYDPDLKDAIQTVNDYVGGPFGFCSAHACNTSSMAMFTWLLVRKRWFGVFGIFWVLLNCWSRIYLGVHFVGDIVCGMILGVAIAYCVFLIYKKLTDKYKHHF